MPLVPLESRNLQGESKLVFNFFRKWYPLIAIGSIVIFGTLFLFLAFRPKWGTDKAKYVDGRDELVLKDVHYRLINDVDTEAYVGSGIVDVLKTQRGERAGAIVSGGIMTMAVLYRVKDDASGNYLVDSVGRIYAKKEIAEAEKERLADLSNYPVHCAISGMKDTGSFVVLKEEAYEIIRETALAGEEPVKITDKSITEDYEGRRELFAFSEDRMWYRACGELFLYKNDVYVTTGFQNEKETADRKAVLSGRRLPDSLQDSLRTLWQQ